MLAEFDEAEDPDEIRTEGGISQWAARQQRQHAAWVELRNGTTGPSLIEQYLQYLPGIMEHAQWSAGENRDMLQSKLDNTPPPACPCSFTSESSPAFTKEPDGKVTYFGIDCTFDLVLSKFRCLGCKKCVSMSPLALGCLPSTPTSAQMWFDLRVMHLYRRQALEGMSVTGD